MSVLGRSARVILSNANLFLTPRSRPKLYSNSLVLSWVGAAVFLVFIDILPAYGLQNRIPENQKPILNVFPPAQEQTASTGKFVIFTREQVGKDWDFVAGAWECIPSLPEVPITKRVEFCHSSWNAGPLLDSIVSDDSEGLHPRFVRLQVDSRERAYTVNLYDINYRTWDVRCIWQGSQLQAFGKIGDSIFCSTADGWLRIDVGTGESVTNLPFTPIATDGNYWLVRKAGEVEGCWSYDRRNQNYVAHFGAVDTSAEFSWAKLSPDGKSRAWVLASPPGGWSGGALAGKLIVQREGKKDISVPIEIQAMAGSGVPVIPQRIELTFLTDAKLEFRAWKGGKSKEDRIWSINLTTGQIFTGTAPHVPTTKDDDLFLHGVAIPDYLRQEARNFKHFGRGGLAPAFLLHSGILTERPEYSDCTVGVSPDGRHVLYRVKKGPLSGFYIYGDLLTKQTVRLRSPVGLESNDAQEFLWVEAP